MPEHFEDDANLAPAYTRVFQILAYIPHPTSHSKMRRARCDGRCDPIAGLDFLDRTSFSYLYPTIIIIIIILLLLLVITGQPPSYFITKPVFSQGFLLFSFSLLQP